MTDAQINQLNMYIQVQKTYEDFPNIWSSNARLTTDHSTLLANILVIEAQRDTQEVGNKGISQDKNVQKESLVTQAAFVATAVKTFANDTNNNELANNVNYSISKLRGMREMELLAAAKVIHEKAQAQAALLSDYGITAATLPDLLASINAFKELQPKPQKAINSSKTATKTLAAIMKETNELLSNQMDGKMAQYERTAPDFFNAYTNARQVISRGKSSAKKSAPPKE